MSDGSTSASGGRISSLDQFRGYTVLAMLVVNFLGRYAAVPTIFKHDTRHCSYADTIMPGFFFAVGFAYRLTFHKRLERDGTSNTYRHAIMRCLGLILLGVVLYQPDFRATTWDALVKQGPLFVLSQAFQKQPFQALVHIGLASIWITPVIAAPPRVVLTYLGFSTILYACILHWFYFEFAWRVNVIDGGPLGFIAWSIPTLVGALACDAWKTLGPRKAWLTFIAAGAVAMVLGQFLTGLGPEGLAPLPFWTLPESREVDHWTMSQRTGSLSYQIFAAGFSLAVMGLFVLACDLRQRRSPLFATFGTNALAAYVIHDPVNSCVARFVPGDAPGWYVTFSLLLYLGICWLFLRSLEKRNLFLRI